MGRTKYSRSNLISASYSNRYEFVWGSHVEELAQIEINMVRAMGIPLDFLRGRA
jgi:hypothetical protein